MTIEKTNDLFKDNIAKYYNSVMILTMILAFILGIILLAGGVKMIYYLYFSEVLPPNGSLPLQFTDSAGSASFVTWEELKKGCFSSYFYISSTLITGIVLLIAAIEYFSFGALGIWRRLY